MSSKYTQIDVKCDEWEFSIRIPHAMQLHRVDKHDDRHKARFNTMQELFLTGLTAQLDNLMEDVIESKEEVLEHLPDFKIRMSGWKLK